MVGQILRSYTFFRTLGAIFLSTGLILSCFLISHFTRKNIEAHIIAQANYLLIDNTPVFEMPPATPLPTLTPTPTATPLPLPPVRISIPAIDLNTIIEETYPTTKTLWTGKQEFIWESISYAIGHYNTSGFPGEGTNIVLAGHNNTEGAVFRRLEELDEGDDIIVYTADKAFYYEVLKKIIVPYRGFEAKADASLRFYAAPKSTETVTLISCWPYITNKDRIVVIAQPALEGRSHAH
jgi:LPXTG-site transpeptidase (sortase) family protein